MARSGHGANVQALLQSFFELPHKEQLETYAAIRGYLSDEIVPTEADKRIDERTGALEALRAAADHLELGPGEAPSPAQFDEVARELGLGWNRSRVVRAWGRWRTAKRTFLDQRPPELTRRRSQRHSHGRRQLYLGHLDALRRWLATAPPNHTAQAFDDWVREFNASLSVGARRAPGSAAAKKGLNLSWENCVLVAKGDLALGQAPPRPSVQRKSFTRGPHDLISLEETLEIVRKAKGAADVRTTYRRGFPPPVIVKRRKRIWLREDVEAFAAGRPLPARRENELGNEYLDASEVARIVGVATHTVSSKGSTRIPEPVANIALFSLWLRSEVEAHFSAWQRAMAGDRKPG